MYDIQFYQNHRGICPVLSFFEELEKTGRAKDLDKISIYIDMLESKGDRLLSNKEIAKYLQEEIYELRPGRYRVLYSKIDESSYILLHAHIKKDKNEQSRQIKQAIKELKDYKET